MSSQKIAIPFHDPHVPIEARLADLTGRLTLPEKVGQLMASAPAIERLGIPEYDWWNECLHGRGAGRRGHRLPPGHRPGGHLERRPHAPGG